MDSHMATVEPIGLHTETSDPEGSLRPAILLTGGTGFVGMMLLARLLVNTRSQVFMLVRASNDEAARARVEHALWSLFGDGNAYRDRVTALRGDITLPRLGLSQEDFDDLAWQVDCIVHGAASVAFDMSLEDSRRVNVTGTREMIAFGERCREHGRLARFAYVSTAYVAGEHAGLFAESQLDVGQRFRNPYERSKYEAELLVREHMESLPVTLFRPSIVVGEQSTGWTASFNVLYWPLRAFTRGTYLALPARASTPVDVVPVDYVADAITTLLHVPEAEGQTYHLTAGESTATVADLITLATTHFRRRPPRLIHPRLYNGVLHPLLLHTTRSPRRRRALQRSEVFFPYFAAEVRYDNQRTRALLEPRSITPPPIHDYFDRLVDYALLADWGRTPVPRHALTTPRELATIKHPA